MIEDGGIADLWVQMNMAQATLASGILSGSLTFLGAIAAVLLGWLLFRSKVNDLKSAIAETEMLIKLHQNATDKGLAEIRGIVDIHQTEMDISFAKIRDDAGASLADIREKIGGLAASAGQLRAQMSDTQAAEAHEEDGNSVASLDSDFGLPARPPDLMEELATQWVKIRDRIEEIAADPTIDGRTAAKYSRIDRRSYSDLIDSLAYDGRLIDRHGRNWLSEFLQAAKIWLTYRARRRPPTPAHAEKMRSLAADLLDAQIKWGRQTATEESNAT